MSSLKRPAADSQNRSRIFIGGKWVAATGGNELAVTDCGLEVVIGRVASASVADVDRAVRAAHTALPAWSATPAIERAALLRRLAEQLKARREEIASFISAEAGTAVRMSPALHVDSSIESVEIAARLLDDLAFEEKVGNSVVVSTPVGVVAAITPWNYPLFQSISKVAAALAASCTIVHKPSELAPLSAFALAEAIEAADFPPGVYNLVTGKGDPVGEALCVHPLVDKISFTGSAATGSRIYRLAADSIKRLTLELGGKSPSIILDDADLPRAVGATVNRAFLNSGQTCDAWTRLLLPRRLVAEAMPILHSSVERLKLGDQFDESTRLGPLVSAAQRDRVRAMVTAAVAEGATVEVGGVAPPAGLPRGYFFRPTVLTGVTRDMKIAREEVFGPVLVVMAYDSDDEAVEIANDTDYGLSAAVFGRDARRATAIARRVRAGQVVVNGGHYNPLAPFGGIKRSGLGRELGLAGIKGYLESVAIQG